MNFIRFNLFFTLVIALSFTAISYTQTTKVACIGDSVTYGYGIKQREENSYPAQLQQLLGANYKVANFGYSGATMLKNGHKPYWDKEVFIKSQEFEPTIIIIHLGLNDQGNNNWPQHKEEFESDYLDMIATYRNLPSKPTVIICKMTPTFSGHHWFEEGMRENFKEIQTKIEQIAKIANVDVIDLHEPLYRFPEYFPDNLHPTKEGAKIISEKVYGAITGNYGSLKVPLLYGENMVLQRNKTINFEGTANYNEKITIEFNNKTKTTITDFNGNWKIAFDPMPAGGPFPLKIASNKKTIDINNVYVGEVWLASGQSNMDFKVQSMESAATVLKDSLNENIFLFSIDGKALSGQKFAEEELLTCNASNYFQSSGWQNTTTKNIENFSAVAYSFAYNLQKNLNIPVGIICNAIGGSPIQSWVSRETMEQTHTTVNLLNDTQLNPLVDSWVAERIKLNMEDVKNTNIKARHPYQPTLLFDAGIMPIKNYGIKGVIWYQGESNAEKPTLHSKLFKLLVKDWRFHFKNPELSFYFVQLSSIERPTWGTFRDSQRRLLEIPNTGMAVSLDVGNKTDVHPKKKWILGERLSKIALHKNYNFSKEFSGPLLDFVNVKGNKLQVYFKHAEALTTSNGKQVTDIFIANSDKIFVPAKTKLNNNILEVWSSEIKNPRYVKYGYTPFSNGNLINKHGLPASTFSNLVE
ncbi:MULTISPECIES: GDSL-type esterase/lipase family protein [Flavobacteriaceae]|uniref:Sialate O-acetylesterase n=2 Tax=Flavobacteriaceae TaxID=49546 RepID=A0A4Y8AUI2_9FLAO|nr:MULTISPECIES: GDSL-type esterase/lipase family protein [Flavobacteriaceae]TEW75026.1 sialate O-acetylesterase [Gramella jeungdoensis]GGK42168.1 sialate O-acetylesterase [Lutibacter litoralis]